MPLIILNSDDCHFATFDMDTEYEDDASYNWANVKKGAAIELSSKQLEGLLAARYRSSHTHTHIHTHSQINGGTNLIASFGFLADIDDFLTAVICKATGTHTHE